MSTVGRDQGWGKGPCGSQPQSPGCQQVGAPQNWPPTPALRFPPPPHNHLNLTAAADALRAVLEPPCLPAGSNGLRFPSLLGSPGPLGSHPCLGRPHRARPAAIHRGAQPAALLHRGNDTGALSSQATSPRASQIPKSELQPSMAPQTTPSDPKTPRSMRPHSPSPP